LRKRNPAPLGPGQPEPILEDADEPRPWGEVFGREAPLEVDIGFGKGEFLLKLSARHPELDYVGIDYNRQRVFKLRDKLVRLERRNVRLVFGNSSLVVPRLFGQGEVRAFTINFPDPWPKRRHHKRRLLTPAFGAILADRLAPGGELTLATDFEPYAVEIIEVLSEVGELVPEFEPPGFLAALPGRVETLYEQKYREAGRTNRYMRYRRKV
jgi:tRNA (guanine-N7-)-methyltransferase